ncbi:response regulator [Limnohabitans sp.]|uniref:response regulator n=1 Tax=Limnohabitans sp. TaxID=1907725 RepID=UPI00286EC955|nr:response regulator [Limnohabitans sp.]
MRRIHRLFTMTPQGVLRWPMQWLGALLIAICCWIVFYTYAASERMVYQYAVESAQAHADSITQFRNFYAQELVPRSVKGGMAITHDYKNRDNALPLPATLTIDLGHYLSVVDGGTQVRLYSDRPFPWRQKERQLDDFQSQALAHLKSDPNTPFAREEVMNGVRVLRFAQADRMQASCVACHNSYADSPYTQWKEGDVRGALEIILPVSEWQLASTGVLNRTFTVLVAVLFVGLLLVWLSVQRIRAALQTSRQLSQERQIAIQQLNTEMAERAQAERQLVVAKDKAEQANQLRGEFLANMSHEIRTPMNGIVGMTELALELSTSDSQKEYLTLAKDSANHLLQIINEILDFSKIEANALELMPVELCPAQLIRHTTRSLEQLARAKGIELHLKADPSLPDLVWMDPVRMRQVLTNLIGNAIKFTNTGSVTVTTHVDHEILDEKSWLRITIEDTGIGFDPARTQALFSPFTQADGSVTRSFGGTGLGLAITRSLLQLMGGDITAEGRPGLGATFVASMPLHVVTHSAEVVLPGLAKTNTPMPSPTIPALSVLLVEDHEINRKLAEILLKRMGCRYQTANDGVQALDRLAQEQFDVVLMDVMMPEMDGLTALSHLRQEEALTGRHTNVLMVTAHAITGDRERFLAAGADGYVSKPMSQDALQNEIDRVLALNVKDKTS